MPDAVLRGLYAITSDGLLAAPDWLARAEAALRGGTRVLQYRAKAITPGQRNEQARALAVLCARFDVPLIINDDPQLARDCEAAGVHLGDEDVDVAAARAIVGERALIGVSCYNEFARARRAQAEGADYVAFGSFFPSPTKPDAARADAALLHEAARAMRIPIVAIGGITLANAALLIDAGADAVAMLSGLFDAPDIRVRAHDLNQLFQAESEE